MTLPLILQDRLIPKTFSHFWSFPLKIEFCYSTANNITRLGLATTIKRKLVTLTSAMATNLLCYCYHYKTEACHANISNGNKLCCATATKRILATLLLTMAPSSATLPLLTVKKHPQAIIKYPDCNVMRIQFFSNTYLQRQNYHQKYY
jgi:hypothetical protein